MKKEINKDLIKFYLERLKGKRVVVNCKTEEQFQNFVDWSYSLNYFNSKSNFWKDNTVNSYLKLSSDLTWTYENIDWFKNRGYEIISYEEALLKEPNEDSKDQHKENTEPTKLSDFLKENNCYEKFINNFDKGFSYSNWGENIYLSISSAFVWKNTEEDYAYWDSIDDKWKKIKHKENDLKDFFEDKTESKSLTKEDRVYFEEYMKNQKETKSKEQSKETLEEVFPFDKDETKLLVEFLQNKIDLTKETYERDINRYTSLMNKYQNILKEVL